MIKKSLFLGTAALALLVIFALLGCSNPASEGGPVTIGIEGHEVDTSELRAILAEGTPGTYALVSNNTTATILGTPGYTLIPSGVTLNLYGSFTIGTSKLTVGGNLNITRAATLTAAAATNDLIIGYAEIENDAQGTVTVKKDGRLMISTSAAVKFANRATPAGGTGTLVSLTDVLIINHAISENARGPAVLHGEAEGAQLVLEEDSILFHTTPLATGTDATALKNLADAKFVLNLTTTVTDIANLSIRKGTSVVASGAFRPTGTLTVNGSLTTAAGSTINADLTKVVVGPDGTITASQPGDTFAAATKLLVDGVFTSTTATFAALEKLEVNGIVNAPAATLGGLGELVVNGNLTAGDGAAFTALAAAQGPGSLTLGTQDFGVKAAILLGIKNVTSAATDITAPTLTVPQGTTLTLIGAAAPTGNVVVAGSLIVRGAAAGITIDAEKTLNITGTVSLVDEAALTLTAGATTTGARITGTGTLTAGNTDIIGGPAATAGWQAVYTGNSSPGEIEIEAGAAAAPATATITGDNDHVFAALGPGAAIIQRAGAGNNLTLADDTVIRLGTTSTKAGEIILKNSVELTYANAGKITLTGTGSVITTGNTGTGSGPLASDPAYTAVASGPAYTEIAVPFLHGLGTAAGVQAGSSLTATYPAVAEGKLTYLAGGTSVATVIGGDNTSIVDGTHDGSISADTITQPTAPLTP
jgi:hypothetical protein